MKTKVEYEAEAFMIVKKAIGNAVRIGHMDGKEGISAGLLFCLIEEIATALRHSDEVKE